MEFIMRYLLILFLFLGACGKEMLKGDKGDSMVYKTVPAQTCTNGGSIVLMATDSNQNGVLDSADSNIVSMQICNGNDGKNGADGKDGKDGKNGTDGVNGINGVDGKDGANGTDGINGANGADGKDGANGVNGTDGVNGVDGKDGKDGTNGVNGVNGVNGKDGKDGKDGANANSDFTPVNIIDPCGDKPGIYDEVLLKLGNGQILASFSDKVNGENTRFSLLPAGNYVTTDDSKCYFTVDANNNVINQHY